MKFQGRWSSLALVSAFGAALTACGGGGGSTSSASAAEPPLQEPRLEEPTPAEPPTARTPRARTPQTGVFLDSPVAGIRYRTATRSGVTDNQGRFSYLEGESVTFSIGDIDLPSAPACSVVTPLDLVGTANLNDTSVVNIARLLQTLDGNGNPTDGITILDDAHTAATGMHLAFGSSDFDRDVINLVANSGSRRVALVEGPAAVEHLQRAIALAPDAVVRRWFPREASPQTYVSFVYRDFSPSSTASRDYTSDGRIYLDMVMDMLAEFPGQRFTWCPDDNYLSAFVDGTANAIANRWISEGHELCTAGNGSDSWNITQPFAATYSGAGTNPRITVSADRTRITLETDRGVDAVITASLERGAADVTYIGNAMVANIDRLTGAVAAVPDWDFVDVDDFWDDTPVDLLEAGTYRLRGGRITIDLNIDRRNAWDIADGKNILESLFNTTIETFLFVPGIVDSWPVDSRGRTAGEYARELGYTGAIRSRGPAHNLHDLEPWNGNNAFHTSYTWRELIGDGSEVAIRSAARAITSAAYCRDHYTVILTSPALPELPTENQLRWFVDELTTLGVQMASVREMAARR